MPLIPLFNDGQQVPQAQIGPAPQGQRQRVIMDLNAATANFATPLLPMELADRSGYDRLGQAFGNASDLLGGLALKKAEAVNIRRVGEGQAQMQQQLAEFDAWKQKNPDETTWEGEWAGRLETMRESVFGENLSPAARETLQTSYQQFASQSKIGLTTEVMKVSFRKAAETQLGLAANAFEKGDPATADAHLKKAADAGYLSREDARRSSAAGHAQVKARALDGLKNLHQQADVALEGNDLPTAAHFLAESRSLLDDLNGSVLDSPQYAEHAATLAYQENHYTLRQQMLESPLDFQAQVSTGQRDFKKLSPQDQHALLDGAQQQVQKRGFEEAQKAAGIIARADVDDLSLTKGMEMTSLQDFGIREIDHVPEPLRHALSFQTRVKQGLASLDRPGLSQQVRTWITGYDPAQDPGSLRRQEMELWFDLSFDRPTAGRLRQELAAQVQQPYPAVSLHRAFARADELATGIPLSAPAPHWTESLAQYYPQDRQRSQQADQVKDLLVRKQKSGDLKDEDAALALVEAAYTPEKRGPAHGGTAIIPVNIGAELSQLPEQTTSKDGRVDPVYNPFHVSLVKGGPGQPSFRSPLAIARAAAQHDLSPVEIAQALKEHHRQQEKQGRQGDVKSYWSGMAQLDADTTAVMQRLQVSAQQQILQSRLTDPEQMRRFQAILAQRVQAPEQPILPEFLPLMKDLDAVLEAPAFQATRPASTYGSVKEGETTLAYYGTRLNAEGQLDLLIQLSDDRQYLRSLPPVTPADVQAKITELENTIRHSQAQAESARARLSGPSLAAMGPGAMGAANGALAEIEHAEQKVQQAQAEQQQLAAQGPRYLLDQRVREELKKPEWEGLVGTYNAGEEILKGLARAGLHANALVTRLFGEENGLNQAGGHLSESLGIPHTPVTLKRLNAAEQALDTALPGSTRRRLEGGTWNQAVLGLQQGAGYMAPGLLGGWGVSLAARGTSAAARIAAGRIGVAGGSSFITAAGGSYVQTEGLIQQALADNDPARAQQLAKYRDAHALLTGLTELAIERFSPLHKMTPNGMHGIAKNAVDMGKEVAENPLTSLLQQNVLDRGLLGTPGYDWNNLPAELLTSLMTAGLLKSGQKGIERLAGGPASDVNTQAPMETPPIGEAPAVQADAANFTDPLSQEANNRRLTSSQDPSAPGSALPAGAPSPQRQQIDSVITRLQQQAPGLVHDRTLIFSNEAEALASDYAQQHPFTDKARAEMQGKEGFFDITTGSTVILANNVRRRAWETESQALTRTVIRHRIGYDGLSILFGNNKGDVKKTDPHTPGYQRWVEFSAQIPRTELDAIARDKAYRHLDGDPEALKLAWFAREVENTPSPEAMRPLARQMWDFLSDVVGKLFVKAGLRDARTPGFNADLKDYIFLARDAALKNGGQTPQSIATSSTSGRTGRPLLSTTLTSDGMPADTASRITSLWKPHRPEAGDYLPEKRTQEHLELFKGGVSKIMKAVDYEHHTPVRRDGTTFVMPTWQLEAILDYAKGDRVKLEKALGMKPGEYKGAALVRVDFTGPETYKLRVPSGNEDGANELWIPGGLLPKVPGREPIPEATLDLRGRTDKPWTTDPLNL